MYFLKAAPVWQTVYAPLIVLCIANLVQNAVNLVRPQPTWFRPAFGVATTLYFMWIVRTLFQTRTYLLPINEHTAQAAVGTNLAIFITIICTAVGLSIALFIYVWQLIAELTSSLRSSGSSATRMA